MSINTLYREGISCACKDGISYPNKFMFSVLEQLGINFKTEYSPKWCKYLFKDKLRQGRYDFYFKFNDKKYIIEMDGKQHKKEINVGKWIKFKEQVYIDNQKDQLAIQHGIHIIRIDSEKSELNFIKNNILDKLSKLFDLHKIDWLICHDYACCSRTKEVWDLWKDNINNIAQLSSLTGISKSIVNKYLKQGNELNIIKYNPRESIEKLYEQKRKSIVAISPNQDISVFNSMLECEKYSMKIFGVKLYTSCISSVCKGDRNKHKGYIFKYIKDLTTEEYIKYDIENKLNELHNNELVQAC
jgi:very-short-patch-repair endonuclease